ncbi:MAG: ABC transporter permease [Acidimicrobiales bacterium]
MEGRLFGARHDRTEARVAVLSRSAANLLGVADVSGQRAVFIDDVPFLLVGIVDSVPRSSQLEVGVIVPASTARKQFGAPCPTDEPTLLVRTSVGAAETVARQLAVAVRPTGPELIAVVPPITPRRLANEVGDDLRFTFLGLGLLALAVGGIGIANATTVAVLERRGEIGLRMALGARRRHIVVQFLSEALTIGVLGGALAGAGSHMVVDVSVAREWTPVLDVRVLAAAPLLGGVVGAVAGVIPALRAARLDPATALRQF